ncbi:2-C-methyl-D-erythritol 4-phosphate cytidylyltransferase [Undibacterium sp. CY18W]|uniref:2-C-methyl-D-erythritol 4-phosphate cytidylyltransferase n=1 Tax=Undibacterium hunanense TaxID=2762292 RepID=A0ABR6ZJM9_9BURK|nr:2-C-methyl-D-erythritol 4-phosphate cytidylyltransferase [Undibacterium hunanense]MBC3916087.1 2-C-methyl-D-erythritol 4-phosphate cytidylyltransferase [Undibacterium hunanense]
MVAEITLQDEPRYFALIPAAGVGSRMGAATPKQYLQLGTKTILQHTVDAFLSFAPVQHTFVVVSAGDSYIDTHLQAAEKLTVLRCGGETRRDTVRNGLRQMAAQLKAQLTGQSNGQLRADDWVLVHDAARPGLNQHLLQHLLARLDGHTVGGLLALPVVDTIKQLVDGRVKTVPRDGMWLAQTPQMFRYQLLCDALDQAEQVTDEASAIEAAGHVPELVEGHPCNAKLTLPGDLALIARLMDIPFEERKIDAK